jgi:Helix-turn-helix.
MIEVKIVNKIEEKIKEHKKNKGVSMKFIQEQLDISKQSLYNLFKAEDINYKTLIKLSILLECEIEELIEYKIVEQ